MLAGQYGSGGAVTAAAHCWGAGGVEGAVSAACAECVDEVGVGCVWRGERGAASGAVGDYGGDRGCVRVGGCGR